MTSIHAKTNNSASFKKIVFVVFPQVTLLDIAGPLQVFTDACSVSLARYEIAVISIEGGEVSTDTVLSITTEAASEWKHRKVDTLIIAGGHGSRSAAEDKQLVGFVKRMATRSRRVGSVCTGAFILAATGLLNGRRAVTHWKDCAELASMYQRIRVEPDSIFVRDGDLWTSAGVAAGIDMALAMVAEDFGRSAALAVARSLVFYMVRPGGQTQFSAALTSQSRDSLGRFDALHTWILDNLMTDLRVVTLAKVANMSSRNFSRIYTSETGRSPAKAVETMRIETACRLLEETNLPFKSVALKSGLKDEERLRRAMQRQLHISPSDYRERFK